MNVVAAGRKLLVYEFPNGVPEGAHNRNQAILCLIADTLLKLRIEAKLTNQRLTAILYRLDRPLTTKPSRKRKAKRGAR